MVEKEENIKENIENKTIILKKVKLKENEKHCKDCDGIGWIVNKHRESLLICKVCYGKGYISLCENKCGREKYYGYSFCKPCLEIREKETQRKIYENAKKVNFKDADKSKIEVIYSDVYGYNEGYFSEIEELEDYCYNNEIELPKYVYGTYCKKLKIDVDDMLSLFSDDLHEDAIDNIPEGEKEKLQSLINEWISNQYGTETYYQDESYIILLNN